MRTEHGCLHLVDEESLAASAEGAAAWMALSERHCVQQQGGEGVGEASTVSPRQYLVMT